MKALVFAAGLGTRLRPLTDTLPKALVDVNGVPLLELVIRRLAAAGVAELVVNTHHFHEKIAAFLAAKNNFGLKISLSRSGPWRPAAGLRRRRPCWRARSRSSPATPTSIPCWTCAPFTPPTWPRARWPRWRCGTAPPGGACSSTAE